MDEDINYQPIIEKQDTISKLFNSVYNCDIRMDLTEEELEKVKNIPENIQVYNNVNNPLFLAKDIAIYLNITNIVALIKSYDTDEKIICKQIRKNGKVREVYYLTKLGVIRTLYSSRSALAKLFRKFFMKLLEHLMDTEREKVKEIYKQTLLENPELVYKMNEELMVTQMALLDTKQVLKQKEEEIEYITKVSDSKREMTPLMEHIIKRCLKPVQIYAKTNNILADQYGIDDDEEYEFILEYSKKIKAKKNLIHCDTVYVYKKEIFVKLKQVITTKITLAEIKDMFDAALYDESDEDTTS